MTAREHVDWMLQHSGLGTLADLEEKRFFDMQPDFETAHYAKGFAYPDGKFRFKPDWTNVKASNIGPMGPWQEMPSLPDYWPVVEEADETHPFRLVTAPARNFLNSSFGETPTSVTREGRPTLKVRPDDAGRLGIADGDAVVIGNHRGRVELNAELFEGLQAGVVVAEGIWANRAHGGGVGINMLTGSDEIAPFGGAAFHDTKVWLRKL